MKKIHLLFLLSLWPLVSQAQWHDNLWISVAPGLDNAPSDPPFPATWVYFDSSSPRMMFSPTPYPGYVCNLIMCDEEGSPLFFSNGYNIFHIDGPMMENGDSLAPIISQPGSPSGDPERFSLMGLPHSPQAGDYYVIQLYTESNWTYVPRLLLSRISGATTSNSGIVDYKNKVLFTGHNKIDLFNANRHANGRDWWVVFSDIDLEAKTRIFYSLFLGQDTVYIAQSQVIDGYEPVPDNPWEVYAIQRIFSPDGKYLITLDAINGVRIHSFDRCTGLLGPLLTLPYQMGHWGAGGVAVSPNSRFLYVSNSDYVFQYDLLAADIEASKDTVGVYDGFIDAATGAPCTFSACQLNANGKIYFFVGGRKWAHYIARPNQKACNFVQHAFEMPMVPEIYPVYPHYRLGPMDGSTCDTLAINNEPLADFWWFPDNGLEVEFSDNSYYEPTSWHWDFGDGASSQDTNPVHHFPAAGTYNVCLVVSNQYAADTVCKAVTVGVTGVSALQNEAPDIRIFPNPASDLVSWTGTEGKELALRVYNSLGQLVLERRVAGNSLDLGRLPGGIYRLQFLTGGREPVTKTVVLRR